eukprot:513117_1
MAREGTKELLPGSYIAEGMDQSQIGDKWDRKYQFTLSEQPLSNFSRASYNLTVRDVKTGETFYGEWNASSGKITFSLTWYGMVYQYDGTMDISQHTIHGMWYHKTPQNTSHQVDPGHSGTFNYKFESEDDIVLDIGLLHRDKDGACMKPQFKFAIQNSNFDAYVGVGDVRDGLEIGAGAEASTVIRREGSSWVEVVKSIKTKSKQDMLTYPGFKQLFGLIQEINKIEAMIFEKIGVNPAIDGVYFIIDAKIATGVSADLKLKLGWKDTDGYHMVGANGAIMVLVAAKVTIFGGYNPEKKTYKVLIGASNVTLTVFIRVEDKENKISFDEGLKAPLIACSDEIVVPNMYCCLGQPMNDENLGALIQYKVMYWVPFTNVIILLRCLYVYKQQKYRKFVEGNNLFKRFFVHIGISV